MKWCETPIGYIQLQRPEKFEQTLSKGRAFLSTNEPGDKDQEVSVSKISSSFRQLALDVNEQFIDREELVDATILALASGQHLFVLGEPGTGKTQILKTLCNALGIPFSGQGLHSYSTLGGLIGPLDPNKLKEGIYQRRFAALATNAVYLLDEVFKAPDGLRETMLTILENCRVEEHVIPLLTVVSASNELPNNVGEAFFDRFAIRLKVDSLSNRTSFTRMLTAKAGKVPISSNLSYEQILLFASASEAIASNLAPDSDVIKGMGDIWGEAVCSDLGVSDRRWRNILRIACANAFLNGRVVPVVSDLAVCKYSLVDDFDDSKKAVVDKITKMVDPESDIIIRLKEKIEEAIETFNVDRDWDTGSTNVSRHINACRSLLNDINKISPCHRNEKQALLQQTNSFVNVLGKILLEDICQKPV